MADTPNQRERPGVVEMRLITAQEVAERLSIDPKTVYGYVSKNLIPFIKIESNIRFDPRQIAEWIERKAARKTNARAAPRSGRARRTHKAEKREITERDVEILGLLLNRRYLSTSQIQRILFPSARTANRRLEFLARKNFVSRFSLSAKPGHGKAEFIYYLRPAGYALLPESSGGGTPSLPRPSKTGGVRAVSFMAHFLEVNDFWINLESASAEAGARIIRFAIYDPNSDLCEGLEEGAEIRPDAYFVLENSEGKRALFFLEVDRGTEKVSSPQYYSFESKARNYLNFFAAGAFQRIGENFTGFRVLVVTTARGRLENLRQAVLGMGIKKLFWFAIRTEIERTNLLLAPVWRLPGLGIDARVTLMSPKSNHQSPPPELSERVSEM